LRRVRIDDREDRKARLRDGVERETGGMTTVSGNDLKLKGQGVLDGPDANRRLLAVRWRLSLSSMNFGSFASSERSCLFRNSLARIFFGSSSSSRRPSDLGLVVELRARGDMLGIEVGLLGDGPELAGGEGRALGRNHTRAGAQGLIEDRAPLLRLSGHASVVRII
jgi:hypothetical protein